MTGIPRTIRINVVAPGLPAWVTSLTPNEITNIAGANRILDRQNPSLSASVQYILGFSGLAYGEGVGTYGSLLAYGGGHGDYPHNDVLRFDLQTAQWTTAVTPRTSFVTGPNGFYADSTYGEWFTNAGGTVAGEPTGSHTYGRVVWCPTGTYGSDPLGYVVAPNNGNSTTATGSYHYDNYQTRHIHYAALSAGTWARGAQLADTGVGFASRYGCSLYDSNQRRIVHAPANSDSSATSPQMTWYDFDTLTTGTLTTTGLYAAYAAAFYESAIDRYMVCSCLTAQRIQFVHPTTGAVTTVATSGTPPVGPGGFDWIQSLGRLVYYPGSGQTLYWVAKPANPLTDTWAWQSVTMTGTARAQLGPVQHHNRFRFIPSLGVFVWMPDGSYPQAVKITGFN